jgi:hypothetical protein
MLGKKYMPRKFECVLGRTQIGYNPVPDVKGSSRSCNKHGKLEDEQFGNRTAFRLV